MNITDFINFMKTEYSEEILESNSETFFENFFYYKRNIRDFLNEFENIDSEDKKNVITFLLNLYPLSDNYIFELLKTNKIKIHDEITLDTINYIAGAFAEEFGDLNSIEYEKDINSYLENILSLRDIIELNENKLSKLFEVKREFTELNKKSDSLTKELKELEDGNISSLREEIGRKKKLYDELKNEKEELSKQYEKINDDLQDLEKYSELKEKLFECRTILRHIKLPKDYTDKVKI